MDNKAVRAFEKLGEFMGAVADCDKKKTLDKAIPKEYYDALDELIISTHIYNGWFTDGNLRIAVKALSLSMAGNELQRWVNKYGDVTPSAEKTIGLVMAGNIPLAGFHDLMCVLLAGHKALVKLSSDDNKILPLLVKVLEAIEPEMKGRVAYAEGLMKNADAFIATGSNNSSRYFEYYFNKFPHIIRKNRNSAAVLSGKETAEELEALASDVFLYFGLGCRSVSKLYVPKMYDFTKMFKAFESWKKIFENKKYGNNYDYIRAIYLLNKIPHMDGGYHMLKHDEALASPVAVIYYEYYDDLEQLGELLQSKDEQLQCVVSSTNFGYPTIPFGKAQYPAVDEYADGIDTLNFLLNL